LTTGACWSARRDLHPVAASCQLASFGSLGSGTLA